MKEVTTEKYMTVNEVAEALKVTDRTIRNMIVKLRNVQSPVQQNKQGGYLLNEKQVTAIKMELETHHNLPAKESIKRVKTQLEKVLLIQQAMTFLKEDVEILTVENKGLKEEIATKQPLVEFAESVRESKSGVLIEEFVKTLRPVIGRNKFYGWLREIKIIMKDSTIPYQVHINKGYFEIRTSIYEDSKGKKVQTFTTLVTGAGQIYLENKWRRENLNNKGDK